MHSPERKAIITALTVATLWASFCSPRLLADGDGKSEAPKAKRAKVDAPAPLTERERWLLDRVDQLEKRVEELEAKSNASAARAPETGPLQPAAPNATEMSSEVVSAGASSSRSGATTVPTSSNVAGSSVEAAPVGPPQAPEQSKPGAQKPAKAEPFAFADFTWMNGNARTKDIPLDTKFFTPEIRFDAGYIYDLNHPADDTIGGSAEVFRAQEFNLTQLGIGGDFHFNNVRGRLMTQFGNYSQTQPRNDASPARGQWQLDNAYRYLAEAYGGYHFDAMHGINVDAGIFLSYIGLFSWYNFDNWAYQPSYVSSNTPFFFNGLRVQFFPTEKLKIEPWLINGWQSYGRFNNRLGVGFQVAYRPTGSIAFVSNGYLLGADTLANPGRIRYHSDSSIEIKYYDNPEGFLDKMAFSLTGDIGCEHGGGVSCDTNTVKFIGGQRVIWPKQDFLGFMLYNRWWFDRDQYGFTIGGGRINNPGRYLVLLPPINGATAASGTSYFTQNPGDPFKAWDLSETFDWMPRQYITFRTEFDHRAASVPYFTGRGGITPTSCPTAPIVENICGSPGAFVPGFTPDLRKDENRFDFSILVKF
jgi:Putative beta-barrel porin-2, OmpL-like. bbp2